MRRYDTRGDDAPVADSVRPVAVAVCSAGDFTYQCFVPRPRRRIEAAVTPTDSDEAPTICVANRNWATQRTNRFFSAMRSPKGRFRYMKRSGRIQSRCTQSFGFLPNSYSGSSSDARAPSTCRRRSAAMRPASASTSAQRFSIDSMSRASGVGFTRSSVGGIQIITLKLVKIRAARSVSPSIETRGSLGFQNCRPQQIAK